MIYTEEYRRTRCVQCGKPLTEHRRFTAQDIEDSKGATYDQPRNGYRAPVSPVCIGRWISHDPMPWKS